jgi:hypothetical protein
MFADRRSCVYVVGKSRTLRNEPRTLAKTRDPSITEPLLISHRGGIVSWVFRKHDKFVVEVKRRRYESRERMTEGPQC